MVDRDKVVKGLECCIEKLDTVVNRTHGFNCIACPYFRKCEAINSLVGLPLARDVFALLKAQEPVKPRREDAWPAPIFSCGKCGACLQTTPYYKAKYCFDCGQAVKWND